MQGKCYRVEMVETDPQQLATASEGALNNMKFASQQVFTATVLKAFARCCASRPNGVF